MSCLASTDVRAPAHPRNRPAGPFARALVAFACLASLAGCVQLPDVERRLGALQLYPNMYVVQAGDTWESVAFRYDFEVDQLKALNVTTGDYLRTGMRINVRPGTELAESVRAAGRDGRERSAPAYDSRPGADRASGYGAPADPYAGSPSGPDPYASEAPAASDSSNAVSVAPVARAPAPVVIDRSRPAPANPQDRPPVVIEQANYDSITGGYPNEEVVVDDLDLLPQASDDRSRSIAGSEATYGSRPASGDTAVAMRSPDADAAMDGGSMTDAAGAWVWPTDGQVARGYAPDRIGGQGVDIAGVPGQDVRAAADGIVVYSGKDLSGGGNLVILRHDGDLMTTYSHADRLFVAEGDSVRAGGAIASLGANPASESVLSFEVRRDGRPLDPLDYVRP